MIALELLAQNLERIAKEIEQAYEDILRREDKVATGKTLRSLRTVFQADKHPLFVEAYGSGGLSGEPGSIEAGRRHGEVLFEADDPDLHAWMRARDIPLEAAVPVAIAIFRKSKLPVPITQMVIDEMLPRILQLAGEGFTNDVGQFIHQSLQTIVNSSKEFGRNITLETKENDRF